MLLIGCEPSPENMDPDGPGYMGLSEPVRRRYWIRLSTWWKKWSRSLRWMRSQNQSATGGI